MRSDAQMNWGAMLGAGSSYYQQGNAVLQVEKLLRDFDTIDLYDVFLNIDQGGRYVIDELERLADDNYSSSGSYKFKVLKNHDEKGHPCEAKPGDVYHLHIGQKERYRDPRSGRVVPMTTRQSRLMSRRHRVRGDENDIDNWIKLPIDEDCCVTVNFRSACNIIINRTDLSVYEDKFIHFAPYYDNEHEKKKRTRRPRAKVEENPIVQSMEEAAPVAEPVIEE